MTELKCLVCIVQAMILTSYEMNNDIIAIVNNVHNLLEKPYVLKTAFFVVVYFCTPYFRE